MRLAIIVVALTGVGFGLAWSLGCCSSPDAESLDEGAIEVVSGDPTAGVEGPAPATAPAPDAPAPGAPASGTPAPTPTTPTKEPAPAPHPSGLPPPRVVTSNGARHAPQQAAPAKPADPTPAPAPAPAPAASAPTPVPSDMKYSALKIKSVKGGQLVYAAHGTPDGFVQMLGDFENALGNRAWAQTYETLERSADRVVAKWKFRGKMGINPTVHIEFVTTKRSEAGATVEFKLVKKSLGIASFFGDFKITRLPGTPPRVQVVQRQFIDSGISFANASAEDIEKGLREDARLIRLWMEKRTAKK